MKPSKNCVDIVIHYECSGDIKKFLTAYLCPAGVPTIGAGTTVYPNGSKVKLGDTCTEAKAIEFLENDLGSAAKTVSTTIKQSLPQHKFDALVSFVYNVGARNFSKSTMVKYINNGFSDSEVEAQFHKWVMAKGKKLKGLILRRNTEGTLYAHNKLNLY